MKKIESGKQEITRKEPLKIDVDIQKILGLDKKVIPNPKSDGTVPIVGMCMKLRKETSMTRGTRKIIENLGNYKVKRVTNCLVCCDLVKNQKPLYSVSFRIADFKAGLLLFEEIEASSILPS